MPKKRMDEWQIAEAMEMVDNGMDAQEVAKKFGVHRNTIVRHADKVGLIPAPKGYVTSAKRMTQREEEVAVRCIKLGITPYRLRFLIAEVMRLEEKRNRTNIRRKNERNDLTPEDTSGVYGDEGQQREEELQLRPGKRVYRKSKPRYVGMG